MTRLSLRTFTLTGTMQILVVQLALPKLPGTKVLYVAIAFGNRRFAIAADEPLLAHEFFMDRRPNRSRNSVPTGSMGHLVAGLPSCKFPGFVVLYNLLHRPRVSFLRMRKSALTRSGSAPISRFSPSRIRLAFFSLLSSIARNSREIFSCVSSGRAGTFIASSRIRSTFCPYELSGRDAATPFPVRSRIQILSGFRWLRMAGEWVESKNWQFGNVSAKAEASRRCQDG